MSQLTISTELVRRVRNQPPSKITDYRDAKVPGFVLRARPTGIHSWRVQLPNRRWLTLGRVDELALSDAREGAQQRRAQAALAQVIPTRNAMPLGKIRRRAEDENAVVRYLSEDEEARLRAALIARDTARRAARISPSTRSAAGARSRCRASWRSSYGRIPRLDAAPITATRRLASEASEVSLGNGQTDSSRRRAAGAIGCVGLGQGF